MYIEYFNKFKGMTPYLHIDKEEWSYIKNTFEISDVKESLATICMEYPLPTADLTESDARSEYLSLKGTRWRELLKEGEWFPRKATDSKYSLDFKGKKQYIRRINTGNAASNYFQQKNRWSVDGTVSPGPQRTWESFDFMKTLMGGLYTLKFESIGRNELRVCLSLRKYICSQFKPNVAKALYDYLECENVLDISAGWGDRLCGFFASEKGKHYVGIDPRKENHPIYREQADFYTKHNGFFETEKIADFIEAPAEDADLTMYKDHFDIVFSSPPYFNVERYSYDDTQSWVRYKNIDAWNKLFLHKTIENVWPTIKDGGYLAINIADVYAASKGDGKGYQEITNPMNDYISTLEGAVYEGCLGMEMAKRPGSAGAGAIIEGDEGRYTEEALLKAEEGKNKIFCEPVWVWRKQINL
jgi:16S rRNA G966 N2-methylase RsmD